MLIDPSPQRKNNTQIPAQVIHEEERDSGDTCSGLGRPAWCSSNTDNAPSTDCLRITCRNKMMKDLGLWARSSITSANRKLLLTSVDSKLSPQALRGSCLESYARSWLETRHCSPWGYWIFYDSVIKKHVYQTSISVGIHNPGCSWGTEGRY